MSDHEVGAIGIDGGTMDGKPMVRIFISHGGLEREAVLTPDEARDVARNLIQIADKIEQQAPDVRN